ncbi:hypothetical protein BC358_11180 [Hydrogenophaga sp. H7]|nr:hypothetical protein BC358_11180 [Hydrogenophaga sp. H7]
MGGCLREHEVRCGPPLKTSHVVKRQYPGVLVSRYSVYGVQKRIQGTLQTDILEPQIPLAEFGVEGSTIGRAKCNSVADVRFKPARPGVKQGFERLQEFDRLLNSLGSRCVLSCHRECRVK